MLLVYLPDGEEPQEFPFEPETLLSTDAEDIEDVGGSSWETYQEFSDLFRKRHRKALRAALWVSMRAAGRPALTLAEVSVRVDQLYTKYSADELRQMLIRWDEQAKGTPEERAVFVETLHGAGLPTDEGSPGAAGAPLEPSGSPAEPTATEPDETSTDG